MELYIIRPEVLVYRTYRQESPRLGRELNTYPLVC